jgi:hypothetical protein
LALLNRARYRSRLSARRRGKRIGVGGNVSAMGRIGVFRSCSSFVVVVVDSSPTNRTTTATTIPLSQPAFDRQRSTIKIEHDNDNEHEDDWAGGGAS